LPIKGHITIWVTIFCKHVIFTVTDTYHTKSKTLLFSKQKYQKWD